MKSNFEKTTLGNSGFQVYRMGLSATYRPGKKTIYRALDEGINFFFAFGIDTQMVRTLREQVQREREKYILATGAYNLIWGYTNIQKTLEKRLRQFKTDYIDIFLFLGVRKEKEFPEEVRNDLYRLRQNGKIRTMGISTHDRKFAGKLAKEGLVDILMIRYNAAHRGAEFDIFPYLSTHQIGLISYTSTRWKYLLRRPKSWPKSEAIPTAAMCYRFVLSNPYVHVCLTAPSNLSQFEENLQAIKDGPLAPEEMNFMIRFGDVVHQQRRWFM